MKKKRSGIPEPVEGKSTEVFSKSLVRRLAPLVALCAVVYGALLLYGDAASIVHQLAVVPGSLLITSALLSIASYVLRAVRWIHYLRVSRLRVPAHAAVLVFVAGFSMSITPVKLGEVLKSLLLKEAWDIPVSRSAPLVIAERVTDLAGLLVLGGVGLLYIPGGTVAAMCLFAAVGVLFVASTYRQLGIALVAVLTRRGPLVQQRDKLTGAYLGLLQVLRIKTFCTGVVLSVAAWGLQCFCVSILVLAFPARSLSIPQALVVYSVPLLAGTLALIPGGLGLTEASMTGALEKLAAMPASEATAITILVRLVTFWLAILLGFGALWVWRRGLARRSRSDLRST